MLAEVFAHGAGILTSLKSLTFRASKQLELLALIEVMAPDHISSMASGTCKVIGFPEMRNP